MKFIYLTSKKYPSRTADHFFAREMAYAYGRILGKDFSLVLADDSSKFFKDIDVVSAGYKFEKGRSLYYFFWLAYFVIKNKNWGADTTFFMNDPNLCVDLILLRKIFRFKYKIFFEWHMLFDDWRDKFIVANSDLMVGTSKRLRELILKRTGISSAESKFTVIYGGVDISKYDKLEGRDLRQELGLPRDKIIVSYIGLFKTLGTTKGIDVMTEALAYLPDNVNMVFVGGKKDEIAALEAQLPSDSLRKGVIFVEKQEMERVPLYQKAVDMLVIPSPDKPPFNNYLLPMKVYEYLASRKPIVYSRLPILEEVLGDCGYGFTPDDPKDLARAISSALGDAGDVKKKSDACYNKARNSTWLKRAEGIINFIKNGNSR